MKEAFNLLIHLIFSNSSILEKGSLLLFTQVFEQIGYVNQMLMKSLFGII